MSGTGEPARVFALPGNHDYLHHGKVCEIVFVLLTHKKKNKFEVASGISGRWTS